MNHNKVKRIIDVLMTVLLFVLMSYQYFGEILHEIAGAILFLLFILHHLLNLRWYKSLGKGRYTAPRILQTVIDWLLFMNMIALMVSGIALSRFVFDFMDVGISASMARNVHLIASHTGFLLMGFHIGLHWGMILKMFRIDNANSLKLWVFRRISVVISAYGLFAFLKRDFADYIFQKSQFMFVDYEELVIFYLLDYIAIIGLMILISYYLQKFLLYQIKRNIHQR